MLSGAALATSVAAITARNEEPAHELIVLVLLTDTILRETRGARMKKDLGLTPGRLLGVSENKHSTGSIQIFGIVTDAKC